MTDNNLPNLIKKNGIEDLVSLSGQLSLADKAVPGGETLDRKVIQRDDVESLKKRDEIVVEAQARAKAIHDRAARLYAKVEDVIRQSHGKGFESGREEGLATVTETLVRLKREHENLLTGLEKEAVALVHEIATKIIGEAFRTDDDALLGMVRQGLNASMGQHITVFLNPADFQRVRGQESHLLTAVSGVKGITLKPMESVKQGSCVIESDLGTVEADLEKQLAAIGKALGLEKDLP